MKARLAIQWDKVACPAWAILLAMGVAADAVGSGVPIALTNTVQSGIYIPHTEAPEPAVTTPVTTEFTRRQGQLRARTPDGAEQFIPLLHTDVNMDVRGLVVSTTVTQQYANETDHALEAVYVFPLPTDGAVYDMEARIGDRVIRSVVKEKGEAKRTYETAKAEGKRTALLEQERSNIFTASVANIMPGDRVDIRIRYVEPLRWDDGKIRLVFPTVVGPRYIPAGVTDAERISPPVATDSALSAHDLSLQVRLDIGVPIDDVKSPTHTITAVQRRDGTLGVTLAAESMLPNKDFVLEFKRADTNAATTAVFVSRPDDGSDASFMMVAFPPSRSAQVDPPPVELMLLMDVSGSMSGRSIEQARQGLLQGLDRLRPKDRFNVIAFDHRIFDFQSSPVQATPENVEAARKFVRGLRADGGTEMLPALEHLLAMPASNEHLRYVVLFTDGCLGNEDQIFGSLRRNLGQARLFTVAIGSAPNFLLATKMAEYGRGSFTHIAENAEIKAEMAHLLDKVQSPVMANVSLTLDGIEATDIYPVRIPDLFLGEPLVVFGRAKSAGLGAIHVEGASDGHSVVNTMEVDVSRATFHPGITTLWARKVVDDRMDAYRSAQGSEQETIKAQVVAHAVRYNLVTQFTSLVAVEDKRVNRNELERVDVPTQLPEGWVPGAVVGSNPQGGTADMFLQSLGMLMLLMGVVAMRVTKMGAAS